MIVPEGKTVFSGTHKYKAGEELPADIAKALEKKMNKQEKPPVYKGNSDK